VGIHVEMEENKWEGMLPMHDRTDDFYEFDEKNYCLIGRRTHKKFQLGDEIEVEVIRTNLEKKQLDFRIAGDEPKPERRQKNRQEKGRKRRR